MAKELKPAGSEPRPTLMQESVKLKALRTVYDPFNPQHLQALMVRAKNYADSEAIPAAYRGKPNDVFVVLELAIQLDLPVFTVLQNCYVVGGRPAFETKLALALLQQADLIEGPPHWRWSKPGDKSIWCECLVKDRRTGRMISHRLDDETVKKEGWLAKKGSKWQTDPKLMFQYRSLMRLIRLYYPAVLLGISSVDEQEDGLDQSAATVDSSTLFDQPGEKQQREAACLDTLAKQLVEEPPAEDADYVPSDEEKEAILAAENAGAGTAPPLSWDARPPASVASTDVVLVFCGYDRLLPVKALKRRIQFLGEIQKRHPP